MPRPENKDGSKQIMHKLFSKFKGMHMKKTILLLQFCAMQVLLHFSWLLTAARRRKAVNPKATRVKATPGIIFLSLALWLKFLGFGLCSFKFYPNYFWLSLEWKIPLLVGPPTFSSLLSFFYVHKT